MFRLGTAILVGFLLSSFARAESESRQFFIGPERYVVTSMVENLMHFWNAPEDVRAVLTEAEALKAEWVDKSATPIHPLAKFLHFGSHGMDGFASFDLVPVLLELVQRSPNNEVVQRQAVRAAVAIAMVYHAIATTDGGGRRVLNELLKSQFPRVREDASEALLLWSLPDRSGPKAKLEKEYGALYVATYFAETNPAAKTALAGLVQRYDPYALQFGPRGARRVAKACSVLLFGRKKADVETTMIADH